MSVGAAGEAHRAERGPCAALVLALCAAPVGCAQLLGGLGEGTARNEDTIAQEIDAGADAARVSPWLQGFAYWVPLEIDSQEATPLVGFTVKLGFDTRALIAAKKMRADGADIRVTSADDERRNTSRTGSSRD